MNRIFRRSIACFVALALSLILISCGNLKQTQQMDSDQRSVSDHTDKIHQPNAKQKKIYGALLESYGITLPVSTPSVYVNQAGYVSGREKTVIFEGDKHGKTFDVVRSQDNTVVYTGNIPAGRKDVLSGKFFSVGDFTSYDEPGTYYIQTEIVGQSYPFRIAEDTYEHLFLGMLKNVSNFDLQESPEGICDVCFGMHAVMYALQCNGTLFEAAYEHFDKSEQDKQLVAQLLYMGKWLISKQQDNGSLYDDYEATAAFCGIMAMGCDMFGRYGKNVEKEYQRAVLKAWGWLESSPLKTEHAKCAQFYAAAQLFKSEGDDQYKTIAEAYLREKKEDYSSECFVFYGVLAYISAERGTDRDLCTYIMKDMVERVEAICGEVRKDSFFGTGTRKAEDNMSNMLHLSFVNYLTPSKEYTILIENTIQYMGGLNEDGICYIGADGMQQNAEGAQGQNFEWKGIMLLSMSDMLRNLSELEE